MKHTYVSYLIEVLLFNRKCCKTCLNVRKYILILLFWRNIHTFIISLNECMNECGELTEYYVLDCLIYTKYILKWLLYVLQFNTLILQFDI